MNQVTLAQLQAILEAGDYREIVVWGNRVYVHKFESDEWVWSEKT